MFRLIKHDHMKTELDLWNIEVGKRIRVEGPYIEN